MENEKSREMRLLGRNFIKIKARQTELRDKQVLIHIIFLAQLNQALKYHSDILS